MMKKKPNLKKPKPNLKKPKLNLRSPHFTTPDHAVSVIVQN